MEYSGFGCTAPSGSGTERTQAQYRDHSLKGHDQGATAAFAETSSKLERNKNVNKNLGTLKADKLKNMREKFMGADKRLHNLAANFLHSELKWHKNINLCKRLKLKRLRNEQEKLIKGTTSRRSGSAGLEQKHQNEGTSTHKDRPDRANVVGEWPPQPLHRVCFPAER